MAEKKFDNIGFEDFKNLAKDKSLSKYEKIGFPDSYREGYEEDIFKDICFKLPALNLEKSVVLDIGPGCSDLPGYLIKCCVDQSHELTLVDSKEMLEQLPDFQEVEKVAALFPDCPATISKLRGKVDALVCYSVLHYVFIDTALYRFWDTALSLLAPGGRLLVGDIPNISMRKRFFASETGVKSHQEYMKTADVPEVDFNQLEHDKIDDSIIAALVDRARLAGFNAWVVPQESSLPMANRREDILVERP